ncbi:MAG TPA: DNA-directed RNA polymerase subunit alpha [Candidatus Portnoybacteria bacterium]|jgi:DNA-directed RNA polymerase subunit alpha|nr:DNA-directed RNA polymerase subunit alpha [Candidatus Portnoybacteria bacterium]MDD5752366.1 DNA-directed RNA polymerase subunit alpha [Candidatus Portnoybacteria bacterium]HOZ16618.1 DNA-directed RNA polymerase subunit alpha [Candidatus Portnoybacteria bacterium]HPH52172.1 DNA-directed RNA polymerase subunit alpha [Candidatus Portnoybacteria bacterium]HPJ80381.1 DNA-directed RNA polymerase subunit alpha [Candidatus Portnoybacteria bacterium]
MEYKISLPLKAKVIKKSDNHAIFEIDNCYPGYGITIGNSFRRVLLSSLPGAAIVSIKIKGVSHEFSTIPNVLEDVVQIILNLKQVRFKIHTDVNSATAELKVSGEKEIKAKDIKTPSDIEVINKDAHIATLTSSKAKLEMEIEIGTGLGYVPVEQRGKQKLEIGSIALDAIYTPIKKVNYEVENMRVGDKTDFNRIKIDIETDGSITPEQAFDRAAEILLEQFGVFAPEKNIEVEEKKSSSSNVGHSRTRKVVKKSKKK